MSSAILIRTSTGLRVGRPNGTTPPRRERARREPHPLRAGTRSSAAPSASLGGREAPETMRPVASGDVTMVAGTRFFVDDGPANERARRLLERVR